MGACARTLGRNGRWHSCYGKQCPRSEQKRDSLIWGGGCVSHNATFGSIPERIKNRFEELSAYPFSFLFFLFFIYVSLCIFPQRPEEGVGFGAAVTSGCVWVSVCVFTIEYYSALKRKGIPTHAVTVNEDIVLSEISHSQKDIYHTIRFKQGP